MGRYKIGVPKRRCEICPAKNRRVRAVKFFGREMMMCEGCAALAARMAAEPERFSTPPIQKFPIRRVATA